MTPSLRDQSKTNIDRSWSLHFHRSPSHFQVHCSTALRDPIPGKNPTSPFCDIETLNNDSKQDQSRFHLSHSIEVKLRISSQGES
jgi:hypothetical protein